jgi:hypothetical protein
MHCALKLPWVTKELNELINKTTKAVKTIEESERRWMFDDDISECDCEGFRGELTALRSTYQGFLMTIIVLKLRRKLRPM